MATKTAGDSSLKSTCFGSVSLYKRNWPLLDQSCAYVFFGVSNSNSSALAPLADFTYRLNGPFLVDEKTIRIPSGDQIGTMSTPGSNVKRVMRSRTRSICQISGLF